MGANTVASLYMNFKTDTPTPPSCRAVNYCPTPSFLHHVEKDSGMCKRGFFSASTTENEATGRRPEDTTARSGIDHLSFTRRIDHLSRRASVPPGRTTGTGDPWRPVITAGRVVINELNERQFKFLGGATLLEGRGARPSVLPMWQRSVLDKSALIFSP